jgi:hypothetical protein
MKTRFFLYVLIVVGTLAVALPSGAHAPSGAIFTTLVDGSEVNFNQFPSKDAVYLDGGPGPGAPASAAGLDEGTYVFQVTDPSGRTLLSTDPAGCRQFEVDGSGLITGVVSFDTCEHLTGTDIDQGATTVQLFPYDDTPNPGGVYKAWVVRVDDFLDGCAELGVADGLGVVDCGRNAGNSHGFVPAHSKTDNFKVKDDPVVEIDTRFFDDRDGDGHKDQDEDWIDNLQVTWNDTLGASNKKWSYWKPSLSVFHEAHVEGVEKGAHKIMIPDQDGCNVGMIHAGSSWGGTDGEHMEELGPQTVVVNIKPNYGKKGDYTYWIDVACMP